MLSILIPTYHYNVYPLAQELEKQALHSQIEFELICLDDGSFSNHNEENQRINALSHCKFVERKSNLGRTATRHELAELANYEWLLFMDADTFPKQHDFLLKLTQELSEHVDLVFGGIAYRSERPDSNTILRWHYGRMRECKPVSQRIRSPYTSVISGGFAIRKALFLKVNQDLLQNAYGLDILFTSRLGSLNSVVKHIDNPVIHLGLEQNDDYLQKSKKALETLSRLRSEKLISWNTTSLLKVHSILYTLGIAKIIGKLIKKYERRIERNLTGENPNLFVFDLYRLGYFCSIDF